MGVFKMRMWEDEAGWTGAPLRHQALTQPRAGFYVPMKTSEKAPDLLLQCVPSVPCGNINNVPSSPRQLGSSELSTLLKRDPSGTNEVIFPRARTRHRAAASYLVIVLLKRDSRYHFQHV